MLDAEIRRREELEEIQRNLQQLLEDQKRAREEDERIRAAKERLLEEERVKREQLEALRLQQQEELQNEKMQKEELIEKQKEQERILEEVKWKLFPCAYLFALFVGTGLVGLRKHYRAAEVNLKTINTYRSKKIILHLPILFFLPSETRLLHITKRIVIIFSL